MELLDPRRKLLLGCKLKPWLAVISIFCLFSIFGVKTSTAEKPNNGLLEFVLAKCQANKEGKISDPLSRSGLSEIACEGDIGSTTIRIQSDENVSWIVLSKNKFAKSYEEQFLENIVQLGGGLSYFNASEDGVWWVKKGGKTVGLTVEFSGSDPVNLKKYRSFFSVSLDNMDKFFIYSSLSEAIGYFDNKN